MRSFRGFVARAARFPAAEICSSHGRRMAGHTRARAGASVVQNGVDRTSFAPLGDVLPIPGRVVFVGAADTLANRDVVSNAETCPSGSGRPGRSVSLLS